MAGALKTPDCLFIPDDFVGYDPKYFVMPRHYRASVSRVLIPRGMILDRTERLALEIFNDIMAKSEQPPTLSVVCVLKGAYPFYSELVKQLNKLNSSRDTGIEIIADFVRLKSYVDDRSVGEVEIKGLTSLDEVFRDKDVLVVEDIVDTGKTCTKLLRTVKEFNPKSVRVVSLLLKRTPLSCGYAPHYAGFHIPERFVIGYGLDYNEYCRDLEHICEINEHGKKKFKSSYQLTL